ncbi:fatty acid synthase subunit alpha, putative [Phytophthora infestans T30-4]|uniref:Fatty acid synthase subunit alpha n=1 Tax=Phytophthora infestans (strain T30-4) TaxID=403677 RepID=D0NFR7_PHYIT|nr:fatty acid synthase subunit alpha, putative [Phytophthora infestans T30-4]EEY57118.1 fatty acid synthase subunit alpha, putative [Phytophthora infestans T30-4]|eukprot:XP_002901728.1 fatty acid synthase subunit alpha, putative [Phytophthora infestans T30-4]
MKNTREDEPRSMTKLSGAAVEAQQRQDITIKSAAGTASTDLNSIKTPSISIMPSTANASQRQRTVITTTTKGRTRRVVTTTTTLSDVPMTTTNTSSTEIAVAVNTGKFTFIPESSRDFTLHPRQASRAHLSTLLEESSSDEAKASVAFEAVIDLHSWLQDGDTPSGLTMSRVFFSMPLLALTQCANYLNFLETTGLTHEIMVKNSATAVGHSQGVVSAVIFSAAKTAQELVDIGVSVLRYMFWQGLRAQETYQHQLTQYKQNGKNVENAGPMLAVRGLKKEHVLKSIEVAKRRTKSPDLHLSLINASDMMNVTGFPATLTLLKQALEGLFAKPDANQTRIPHSQRKPTGSLSFLPLSAPFHTPLLTEAKPKLLQDVQRVKCVIKGSQLQVPVYATNTKATNLQTVDDVVDELINMQLLELVDWTATWAKIAEHHSNATHILEFGPDLGVAKLSDKAAEGLGIELVIATAKHPVMSSSTTSAPLVGLQQFIDAAPTFTSVEATWVEKFGPQVTESGKLVNRFTRALNKPPVMVAGMTPTTSLEGIDLVADIQNAGFHGELAAGGLSRPNIFEDAVNELVSKIKPGLGIAIIMLYLNAKQWGFQFPMVLRMRRSGVPIESITIGAGIPTKERALEMMSQLEDVGIKVVCLKPGSVDGIHAVLEIAEAMPSMTVMLQWTGGRAGGHHSFEDFHEPMEETYAAIRRVSNVLLVVGSGFARGHLFKMPADGILMGSRVMVAKEAATAPEVRKLLVDTPGIESELEWETSYTGEIGGVITVTSELGEPTHVVANRCTLLWKEFDDKYFSIPRDQVELALRLNKKDIITRLNADYQKPYFGCERNVETGESVPADLEEMSYGKPHRWVHDTFFSRVSKFITRTEERFRRESSGDLFDQSELKANPRGTVTAFITKYPQTVSTLLSVPDCDFFLDLCRTGGKPVNFVPAIDTEFKTWFKKDSLWYSEDLDAVPERDAQRVFILQGPVAARYSTVVDEPVADILNGIATGFENVVKESGAVAAATAASAKQTYHPELSCSIHAEGSGFIDKVKAFYARFWVAVEDKEEESCKAACEESVMSPFTAEFSITKKDVVDYRTALGLNDDEEGAPADFSTIVSWRPLIQSVFTKEVKGNLLDLVHLKHSYKLLSSRKASATFLPGDDIVSTSNVGSLRIIDSGKIVHGVAIISRKTVDDQMVEMLEPLVELHSEFLIRGTFDDFKSTFSIDKSTDASVEVSGTLFRDEAGSNVELGTVEFKSNDANESPVVAFLRQMQPEDAKARGMFSNGGSHMLEKPLEINVPTNALAYAVASRDLNPIHRSKYAAILGHLPQGKPIMHGLWTATKVRDLVIQNFGLGFDSNVVDYDVNFDGMVYPGDKLFMQARHIGLDNGKKVLSVEVVNSSGEGVVSARAVVKQAPMAFVFTGQGSAAVGMGMDRYQESSVARDIWNRGDSHLRETFGFSILEIVQKNPKSITVHFGGKKGLEIRENYMKLTRADSVTGDVAALFPEIDEDTESYNFFASEGLLFATQFSQPTLVLLEKAMFSEIKAAQLISDDAYFAGHSLGEYASLISFADALAVEALMDLVFLRGMIMQKSVKRDAEGRSDYGMVAVNPTRVSPDFAEEMMYKIVDGIDAASGNLLQVVNLNIQQCQYVVAGDNVNLETLSLALSAIKTLKSTAADDVEKVMADSLAQARARKHTCEQTGRPFTLARGLATIPLVGIDVPFHSRELLGGVPSFRALLRTKFDPQVLERQLPLLVDRYIPNLVATPFSLKRSYFEEVYAATKSPYLEEVLNPMQWKLASKAQLAHLLVVELLAYQFASPVQWIKTQALLFLKGDVRRFVEIGPAPTLTNMALRTVKVGDFPDVSREILWYQRDREAVHFEEETAYISAAEYARGLATEAAVEAAKVAAESAPKVEEALAPAPVAAPVQVQAAPVPVPAAAAPSAADAPVSALHVLRVLLAVRLNRELTKIKEETDVKTLCAGAAEGAGVQVLWLQHACKMPGGFTMSSIKEYLGSEKGLGAGRMESVLAHSLLLAPQTRFKSDADARKWLDESVSGYASFAGISLDRPTMAASPGAVSMSFNPAPVSIPTVTDKPVEAKHALLVMLAAKFGKAFIEVPETATIKELSAGKSAVQNEIVGDLEKEFGSGPDDAAEMKLAELAGKFPAYASPGKVTSALIAKMLASKMPGGFSLSAIKEYLSSERCLPSSRIESVLLHGLTQSPKARLTDDATAKKWLDGVVNDYAKHAGIDIPYLSKLGGMMAGPAMGQQVMQSSSLPSDFEKRLKTIIADQIDVLNSYLGEDQLDWHRKIETEVDMREEMESSMSQWVTEHGEFYSTGVVSKFDTKKERQYDSYWNWTMQDAMELYHRAAVATKDVPVSEVLITHLRNRATPELVRCLQYYATRAEKEDRTDIARSLTALVKEWQTARPVTVQRFEPTKPQLQILENGQLEYSEVARYGAVDSINYVEEMARGLEYNSLIKTGEFGASSIEKKAVGYEPNPTDNGSTTSEDLDSDEADSGKDDDAAHEESTDTNGILQIGNTRIETLGDALRRRAQLESNRHSEVHSPSLQYRMNRMLKKTVLPHVHVRKPSDVDPTIRLYDVESTCVLLSCMREMASTGISFAGKVALLTGCGKNSIAAEIVKALLEGGATVFVTTSSFSMTTTGLFREIYDQHGSRGSRLIVLPFNQASKVDVQSLVAHIYDVHKLDLDFVIPFAALSEVGRTITDIDSRSELALRIMLTNTMRLLGEVVTAKKARDITTRPALVILPMSPNHGNFGGDGLFRSSAYSEGWDDQLSIVGAIIGWTRGTGLMSGNNVVAAGVEKMGMRTFSTTEMGFNLSALMHPKVVRQAAQTPIIADLTGGMAQVKDLKDQVDSIRADIVKKSKLQASIHAALESDKKLLALPSKKQVATPSSKTFAPRANMSSYYCNSFPKLSGVADLSASKKQALLRGMLDLRQVVVVTGFGEVSPWGNARTRWEMESYGEFSLEGCIELAWLTGRVVFDKGNWVDAKTKEIVPEHEVKPRYEEDILKHSGIRIVEPELFDGYDPKNKMVLHQVAIDKKMSPIEVADREEALQFREELGKENVDIFQNASGAWMIRLRKGSVLNIPRALNFDRFVAGQIPTGWSAERLGLSKDLAESVDPTTLYALAATMDTFVAAGVTDPYEFYQYVHVSEVGNTSGGGMGGLRSLTQMYKNRLLGKPAPSDALQETFINTPPAWVNMLLLSSSGPIKTPVGACATAAESVDIGAETIKSGKARICIVGGYDDFGEEGAFEFAQMKATSDSVKETGMGREPKEMCRPCSTTRGGFMESHGAGMQLLMDAQLALEMGLPIYGIVALTSTATDKNGRSVPAPGQGILTTARESSDNTKPSPLLDVEYRRRQFDDELESIEKWCAREEDLSNGDESRLAFVERRKLRKVQAAQATWGNDFYCGEANIAPLRGALSVWNLDIDDVGVASFHGTGTKANDKNESEVTHKQMAHLGRSPGNPLPVICQKNLTGHPKGAAGAWMLNGLLQVLNSGLIPGNRQLDNTCETLRKYDQLVYPNRSFQTMGVKAVMMKSFGFGQASGEVLLVHPDYLLSTLPADELQHYSAHREQRLIKMNTHTQSVITGKHSHIQVKNEAPYSSAQESNVYLDPTARAKYDVTSKTWRFGGADSLTAEENHRPRAEKCAKKAKAAVEAASSTKRTSDAHEADSSSTLLTAINQAATDLGLASKNMGMGVDVEPVATFENLNGREDFIRRNFTDQEMAYCYSASHPAASFAGRWAAKEAVIKAISSSAPTEPNLWKGAGAPLCEIEICMTASGAPSVLLSGYPLQVFNRLGLWKLSVSISHSGDFAVSQAVAKFQHE